MRSRTAGVMTTLMRNGRDRRSGKPAMRHASKRTRANVWDPISGLHQGQRPQRPHQQAEYMAAPERFAEMPDFFPCTAGAVHTWHLTDIRERPLSGRYRGESGRLTEGRHRLLIEAGPDDAIHMLDPAGIVRSWNPGEQRVKGYASSEIIGQHFSVFRLRKIRNRGFRRVPLRSPNAEASSKMKAGGSATTAPFWAFAVIDPIRRHL